MRSSNAQLKPTGDSNLSPDARRSSSENAALGLRTVQPSELSQPVNCLPIVSLVYTAAKDLSNAIKAAHERPGPNFGTSAP
jgi:hypothetical protein